MIELNVYYELGEYKFEWDSTKAEKNFKKHGIYFEDAVRVFWDDNRLDDFDDIHSDFEDRFKIIGKVREVLVVIYTERGNRNRIISARLADKNEEADYYEQFYW